MNFQLAKNREFWHREVLECIKYLLCHQCYAESIVWSLVREFDGFGESVYSEMHTADW